MQTRSEESVVDKSTPRLSKYVAKSLSGQGRIGAVSFSDWERQDVYALFGVADVASRCSRGAAVAKPMKQKDNDDSESRHYFGRRPFPDATGIFSQGPVAHAVEAVLNSPMLSSKPQ